jgi:hypothetical protein
MARDLDGSGEKVVMVMAGNPVMMDAYKGRFPGNGKPAPDGAKMATIHWAPKPNEFFPTATVPGKLVDFMVKHSKRFADSVGWGYAVFDYDAASDTFTASHHKEMTPNAERRAPRQRRADITFTDYGRR